MSVSSDKIKLLDAGESHQESFYQGHEQDADLPPTELSGDENGQQSVFSQVDSKNKSNFLLTVTTIIKTVIGSGILGLPFTVSKCGWVFASIVFVSATALCQFSSILLLNSKNLSGHSNFSTILYHVYQNKFCKGLGSIVIFLNNMGICMLEIIIFKDSISKILDQVLPIDSPARGQWYTSRTFIALAIAACEIPSILVKKIERLKFMAFIGVAGILVFMGTFVVHYGFTASQAGPYNVSMNAFPTDWFDAIASIPNLILALGFQMNFFPVYKGMRRANDTRFARATLVGLIICSASYLLIGILGYHLAYVIEGQDEVKANFLLNINYEPGVRPFIYFVINICFLLSVFFAFPIMFFGCRNNFIALIQLALAKDEDGAAKKWRQNNSDNIEQISSYIQSEDKVVKKRRANLYFYIYTFAIFAVIVATGVALNDIQAVFNVIGAICSTSISMLLPCFFYFILILKKDKKRNIKFYVALAVFCVMAPFALFSMIAHYVK